MTLAAQAQSKSNVTNVTSLNLNRVYNFIQIFLRSKEKVSENTSVKYEKDIRDFFMYTRDKNIEDLTIEDLNILNAKVLEYRDHLTETYKNSTVNGKLTAVRSLYNFLKTNDYPVNPMAIVVPKLPDDTDNIGILYPDEAKQMARLARVEKFKGQQKEAIILFATSTGLRKSSVLRVKYRDIFPCPDDKDKYLVYSSKNFDKGKKVDREIHRVLYEMLLSFKGSKSDDDAIFDLSEKTLDTMIERLTKKMEIDPKRKISFHSLKKAGAKFVLDYTKGDMVAVADQGNWRNIQTAFDYYLEKPRNVAGMAMFEEIGEDVFDKLTRKQAIELLKSVGNGEGARLRKEAMEMVENKI